MNAWYRTGLVVAVLAIFFYAFLVPSELGKDAKVEASGPIEEYEELLGWAKEKELATAFLLDY